MVYPPLLPLMRTPRLPVVDWTDVPADLNGLFLFAERRNLVSAPVPSHLNWPLHLLIKTTRYKLHCKRPFKEPVVKVRKGLLQRSFELVNLWAADKRHWSLFSLSLWETWSSHNATYSEGQQPNTSKPSTQKEKKLIKETFILTTRVGRWQSSESAV